MHRGITLYFAILLIGLFLTISVGLSTISVLQLRTVAETAESVHAFFAADTGVEAALYWQTAEEDIAQCDNGSGASYCNGTLENEASYELTGWQGGNAGCPDEASVCIDSTGFAGSSRRAIRVQSD